MAKHPSVSDDDLPSRKRQRLNGKSVAKAGPVQLNTPRDLELLLVFQQDGGDEARQNLQSFRTFLNSIAHGNESDERLARIAVLHKYLQAQTFHEDEESPPKVADLIKTWHFAVQANVENLIFSVATVLALLLKTISSLIEFRECGSSLCKSLLRDDQTKLYDRSLSSGRAKEYLISSCLKLLTEIVSFDGGHAAKTVFRHREITLNRLDTFLGMRQVTSPKETGNRRKSSVRTIALHYLFANLRLQSPAAKMYLLAHRNIARAVFVGLLEDSPAMVSKLLRVLEQDVALDRAMSHNIKIRFFNEWTLTQIATLYNYHEPADALHAPLSVRSLAHDFLMFICTSSEYGLLDKEQRRNPSVEATLSGLFHGDDYDGSSGVILGSGDNKSRDMATRLILFLQCLRPHACVMQRELLLTIFRNAPHLAADYFSRKKAFTFDPRATATWIGYSTFLLGMLQLPLPRSLVLTPFDGRVPPSCDTVIRSILPLPLNQKVLTRCLNQTTSLIKFLSTQILIAAFEKLLELLRVFEDVHGHQDQLRSSDSWKTLVMDIKIEFCDRIPDIEQVITQYRRCPPENLLLRESLARSLGLYFDIFPHVAFDSKFDISAMLAAALQYQFSVAARERQNGLRSLELDHMLKIAYCSPDSQWWHMSEKISLSLFTMLLRLYIDSTPAKVGSAQLETQLSLLAEASHVLVSDDRTPSVNTLLLSLQGSAGWTPVGAVFEFLDNCILRVVRKPVRYHDLRTRMVSSPESTVEPSQSHIDLLLFAIIEQWPFCLKNEDPKTIMNISIWLLRYIELTDLRIRGTNDMNVDSEASKTLAQIRDQLKIDVTDEVYRSELGKALTGAIEFGAPVSNAAPSGFFEGVPSVDAKSASHTSWKEPSIDPVPPGPPQEPVDHPGLIRWTHEDLQSAIIDGAIEELLLCLCSQYQDIRRQAGTNVGTFLAKLKDSDYSEWKQSFIVIGELLETVRATESDKPLPFFAAVLAANLLLVVADPLHLMYEKINKFLHKGPTWNVEKLPSYWVDKILLNPPTNDEAHSQECEWLLKILINGLRTDADFELYRRCNILERLLSFSASPLVPDFCLQEIIELMFRCTYVQGSSALITRSGIIDWIASRRALRPNGSTADRLRILASTFYERSDKQRVYAWSDGALVSTLDSMKE